MNDLSASIMIENKNNAWVEDNMVTECFMCKRKFGWILNRKHHCRSCGNIFCGRCVNKIVIPDFITDRPAAADVWNPSYYILSLRGPEELVCKSCSDIITSRKRSNDKLVEIYNNTTDIIHIKNLPESSADVKSYYLNYLRNIQYYLPNHSYTSFDKKILLTNALHFSSHSKYLMHLIKSIDWDISPIFPPTRSINSINSLSSLSNLQLITKIINAGEKSVQCIDLCCTRTCSKYFSCDDCINILYTTYKYLPDEIISFLFKIIKNNSEDIILCHMTFFTHLIINNQNPFLSSHLFLLINQSEKLVYHMYWFLINHRNCSHAKPIEISNINNFISQFDVNKIKQMQREYTFFSCLVNSLNNLSEIKKFISSEFNPKDPITLPYDPSSKIIHIDTDNITILSSYTKPVIINFIIIKNQIKKNIKILFKRESIQNDKTVLSLMTLCDIILRDPNGLEKDFNIIVYNTMPLTMNSGMIEIIENAHTIYEIDSCKLLGHIIEKNPTAIVQDVIDRYMYSLVAYTLHSYLIGLGDRHLQNIMITNDGAIFHIDFGFILGSDAYPLSGAEIKLNSGMLDVIGGPDSNKYSEYLEWCSKGIVLLRKYFNMFFILLSLNANVDQKHVENFILQRFQPRQHDNIVVNELKTIILQSNNAYKSGLKDFLHYHTQEKTMTNIMGQVIKSAIGAAKSLTIGE